MKDLSQKISASSSGITGKSIILNLRQNVVVVEFSIDQIPMNLALVSLHF